MGICKLVFGLIEASSFNQINPQINYSTLIFDVLCVSNYRKSGGNDLLRTLRNWLGWKKTR